MGIFLSLSPWIAFWVGSEFTSTLSASVLAFILTLVINGRRAIGSSIKILDLGAAIFFALLTLYVALMAAGMLPEVRPETLAQWDNIAASTAMFLTAAISIVIGRPFTLQYAREEVDASKWDHPLFKRANYVISTAWVVAFAITAAAAYASLALPGMGTLLNLGVPIASVTGAVLFMRVYRRRLATAAREPA